MELTVYRQATKERNDGTIVYKGEDAIPYVDDKIFFVADGLGGAAAIRHQQIVPELFEKDKLVDMLFKGVYEEYSDERFVKYVTDSFFELFAVKDCYTANIYNIKKSGYFASRIVTAIVLHEMIYNESLEPATLFDQFAALETEEAKDAFLNELGRRFADRIGEDIRKVAKNANLIYESSYSGLALLGTTICATIYREKEDCVEAVYLTAGDSRPYVWTEKEGLCQIMEDEEGKDGGMTNYIKANDDATFHIRCNFVRFNKPCLLFNASDGCFDSGYFLSQLAFEKLILDKALASNGTEEMSRGLYETFLTYGTHDDSSTIAMKFFGFESFDSFKESAARRTETISENYLSRMPELLEKDFVAEYEERAKTFSTLLTGLKARFEKETPIKDLYLEKMLADKYPQYEEAVGKIDAKISDREKQIADAKMQVEEIISRNFVRFILSPSKKTCVEKYSISRIQNAAKRLPKQSLEYMTGIIKGYDGEAHSFFYVFFRNKDKDKAEKTQLRRDYNTYISQNKKLASKNKEKFSEICNGVISGKIKLNAVKDRLICTDESIKLKSSVDTIHHSEDMISYYTKEKMKTLEECGKAYWDDKYADVIGSAAQNQSFPIPSDLREETEKTLDDMSELRSAAELQTSIFGQYDRSYRRYLGGNEQ